MSSQEAQPQHGKVNTYTNYGCRCEACKAAQATYMRGLRARRKARLDEAQREETPA